MKINAEDFRAREGDRVDLGKWPTKVDPVYKSKKHYKEMLEDHVEKFSDLQRLHYVSNCYSVLLIFHAMDGAGKDAAIRHVMSGVNPQASPHFDLVDKNAMKSTHDADFLKILDY